MSTLPRFGLDVRERAAVDAVHGEAVRRMRVINLLADEPWSVRRFFGLADFGR